MQLYTGGTRHYHTEPQNPAVHGGSVDLNLTD